jgi:hypothetical protein
MISTELAKSPPPPATNEPYDGTEFVGHKGFHYCRNCKKYHPKEHFIERNNGMLVCRWCNEKMIGVDHEKKVREWLRHIVNVFIDQELGEMKDTASISSMTWAKAFYSQFQGPSQCGATIGAYFKELMQTHPASIGVAGKLVTLMRLLVQVESSNKVPETLPTTREGLIAHMQALAMKAVNQAMKLEATKNLAQAAEFLSENVPISDLAAGMEQLAEEVSEDRNLVNTIGPLDAKPAFGP